MYEQATTVPDLLLQSREIVSRTEELLGIEGLWPAALDLGEARTADAALSVSRHALRERLEVAPGCEESPPAASVAALIMRAEHLQLSLRDALLAGQRHEVESAQLAMNRLRGAVSTSALAERIPIEACLMGFTRVLFSYVRHGTWIACSAFAGDDEAMALAMVEAGTTNPRRLAGPLLEGEMVRRRHPILVRNPQTDARVHNELAAITKTVAYVAAPVFSWGRPIGLVHADRHDGEYVSEFDRETLGVFAEGVGLAFERNLMIERIRAMRHAANEHARMADALADDFTLEVLDLAGPAPAATELCLDEYSVPTRTSAGHGARPLSELTARESEVLDAIAAGKTNAQIASALFVTEGTVKSHVKHILRKLGAGNRTEAVAVYHRARSATPQYSTLN